MNNIQTPVNYVISFNIFTIPGHRDDDGRLVKKYFVKETMCNGLSVACALERLIAQYSKVHRIWLREYTDGGYSVDILVNHDFNLTIYQNKQMRVLKPYSVSHDIYNKIEGACRPMLLRFHERLNRLNKQPANRNVSIEEKFNSEEYQPGQYSFVDKIIRESQTSMTLPNYVVEGADFHRRQIRTKDQQGSAPRKPKITYRATKGRVDIVERKKKHFNIKY